MLVDKQFYWKNFCIGTELQIAGSFIYNGLYVLDNMESFYYEEECFELLYNLSVGLERLMKVAVVLIEHNSDVSQENFEKTLITHNHFDLLNRIKKERKIVIGKPHKKLLSLLDKFYKSARYERYSIESVYKPAQDKENLVKLITEELKISFNADFDNADRITTQIRKFIGNLIGKITIQIYDLIFDESFRIGTFTYEIAYNSKAFKIFIAKEFDFSNERIMQKEAMLYLLKKNHSEEFKYFLNQIEALKFEQNHTNKYIESIINIHKDRQIVDEMIYLYEEDKPTKDRKRYLDAIGSDINLEYRPNENDYN